MAVVRGGGGYHKDYSYVTPDLDFDRLSVVVAGCTRARHSFTILMTYD